MLKNSSIGHKRYVSSNVVNQNVYDYSGIANIKEKDEGIKMKKIIPKSVNYEHLITDPKVKDILKKSPDQEIKTVIDSLTRKHLRQKHPTKIIEGQEKVYGRFIDVWYDYNC